MINLQQVSKTYGKTKTKAVDALDVTIQDGEIFGFLGPNGAGKTTTIKLMTGILHPDSGSISIDGISITDQPLAAKRRFSFVPDTPEIFSRLKASEYLNFIADCYEVSTGERQDLIKTYLETFGIASVINERISSFSHGMKQKLFLTASLLSNPHNWILDEPLVGLDPDAAFKLKELMRERAKQGKTVFFSTHIMEVAEKLCHRIGIINQGKLLYCGTVEQLRAQYRDLGAKASLEDIFLHITGNNTSNAGSTSTDTEA